MPKTHRRRIIEELLDHLVDYEPAPKTGDGGGSGEGCPQFPAICAQTSVRELYRTLDQLAVTQTLELLSGNLGRGSTVHAHLMAFYHSETRVDRGSRVRRWDKRRGRFELVDRPPGEWRRERIVSPWVILPLVERGVVFVVEEFRGEPYLPNEMRAAA